MLDWSALPILGSNPAKIHFMHFFLPLLVALLGLATRLPAQTNLITNGEFDDGLTGWQPLTNGQGQVDVTVVDTAGLSGNKAVRLKNTVPGTEAFNTGILQRVELTAAVPARYRITFLARADTARSIVFQYKVGEASLYYQTRALTATARKFTFEFERTRDEAVELLFFTGIESPAVYLDAVTLTELEPDGPVDGVVAGTAEPVAIGGGGYVTGVHYHPTTCGLLYMRTDVGGAFRYDYGRAEWIPLFTDFTVGQENYFGVNALALAPSDDSVVYVAADKTQFLSGPSDVLVSRDRGATWQPTGLDKRFFGFGNFFSKTYGPALAVDPTDADRVYAGTINSGLWYKDGRDAAWQQVAGIPNGQPDVGVKSIVFAADQLFVGVRDEGIFVRDLPGGAFSAIPGAPTDLLELDVDATGRLFVAAGSGLYTYTPQGGWAQVRGDQTFASVSVHPGGGGRVVALGTKFGAGQGDILYSEDGGSSWRTVEYRRQDFPGWYPSTFWSNAGSSITFDPCEEAAVTYGDFFAVWHTADLSVQPSTWSTYSRGHEETYVTDLMAPPAGHRLYATLADILGFSWEEDVTAFPEEVLAGGFDFTDDPFLNNGSSLDYCPGHPSAKVFAANTSNGGGRGFLLRSDDEFATYILRATPSSLGRVVLSATDPDNMVIYTQGSDSRVYYTTDGGESWEPSQGAPTGISDNFFRSRNPLAADRVAPSTFYVYGQPGKIYSSTDGGATFTPAGSDLPNDVPFDDYEIKARPDVAAELWASLGTAGLYRSTDGGRTFGRIGSIDRAITFGFGRGQEVSDPTVAYVYGVVDGQEGLFYSEDNGNSWTRIDFGTNWPNRPRALTADLREYGRVYIGSNGSGILTVSITDAGTTAIATSPSLPELTALTAYPNPAGDWLQLAYHSREAFVATLTWYTPSGRQAGSQSLVIRNGQHEVSVPLEGLPPGILLGVLRHPMGGAQVLRVVHN